MTTLCKELSFKEQQEYREWARANYTPLDKIKALWHPIVRNECEKINRFADHVSSNIKK